MTNAEIYRLARRLCDLMESDNNDRGERVGMIWQVEGELRKALNEIEARPEAGEFICPKCGVRHTCPPTDEERPF